MKLAMANGFNEMSQSEMMEVDGGFGIVTTIVACVLLGVAAAPAVVSVGVIAKEAATTTATAYDSTFDDERDRAVKDAVDTARRDFANGFRE